MNEEEQRVLETIDVEGMLEYLGELVSIPSYGGEESEAQRNVAKKFEKLGLKVDMWELDFDNLRRQATFSMSFQREEGVGVVGAIGGTGRGCTLILNGHIDTVSPGEETNWSYQPLKATVEDDKVYGLGTADMKGGLCSAIYAAKAIKDAGVRLQGDLIVQSVIGEEDGGIGALATILRGHKGDAAVVMEPTALKVSPAHAGALAFSVEVSGRSAHACVREEGVSAIEKFIPIFQALQELEEERNRGVADPLYARYMIPYPISVGTIHGGSWPGSVPENLTFQGRIGVIVGEKVEDARMSVEKAITGATVADSWLRENPPKVDWVGYQFDSAQIPSNHPLVETVMGAYEDATKKKASLEGMTYASDMRHLVNTGGIPTVLFGPGNIRRAHAPDEYVMVKELIAATRTLALTTLRFCGFEEE